MLPLLARKVLGSIGLLANAARLLASRCIAGTEVDRDRMRRYAEASPAIATGLNRWLGYDEVAAVVKEPVATGRTIREVVIERGNVREGRITEDQLDHALDVDRLARGG